MRWEYDALKAQATGLFGGKVDTADLVRRMNERGDEGWELVNVFDTNAGYGTTKDVIALFKRPKD